jgi:hypothetical protein
MSRSSARTSSRTLGDVPSDVRFDDDVPIEVTSEESSEPVVSQIRVKLLSTDEVRLELSNEADLFFLYEAAYTEDEFAELAEAQGLMASFAEFPDVLAEIFSGAKDPKNPLGLCFVAGAEPLLRIRQHFRFKVLDVFAIKFVSASDEEVHQRIQERFTALKAEVAEAKEDLVNVYSMLKIKNPTTLKQQRRK